MCEVGVKRLDPTNEMGFPFLTTGPFQWTICGFGLLAGLVAFGAWLVSHLVPQHDTIRTTKGIALMDNSKVCVLEEALKAQKALRSRAGLGPEIFPIQAFVGMISDEVESLRNQGQSDEEIASIIRNNSTIEISASEIAEHYASPAERHHHGE